ncbi:MAG: hypothetical protein KF757_12310 [Phycisphaeraceae bacterium]|nr:hypothetical protein [Phycisphaeraceae bacterium]MCW5762474.1 hypothetical protein [Phycisphaeraceae bacterium]
MRQSEQLLYLPLIALVATVLPACAKNRISEATLKIGMVEILPGVFVDRAAGVVVFEGVVPIQARDPEDGSLWSPVIVEAVVCAPDSKEHESLVLAEVLPSHVHAAMLMIGLEPGSPGGWSFESEQLVPYPATGADIALRIEYEDGAGVVVAVDPAQWVLRALDDVPLANTVGSWTFAGSWEMNTLAPRSATRYAADAEGAIISFVCFGSETIAWSTTLSPDSTVGSVWIADPYSVPPMGTRVRVVISLKEGTIDD